MASTGFHPLDGARYLLAVGASTDLVGAVAHHSCARFEAEERGVRYDIRMEYYEKGGSALVQLLWSSPSVPEQIIPAERLTPGSASAPPPVV